MGVFRIGWGFASLLLVTIAFAVPGAFQIARTPDGHEYAKGQVVVGFQPGTASAAEVGTSMYGGVVGATIPNLNVVTLVFPDGTDVFQCIRELRNDPVVRWAEPNYVYHAVFTPNDTNLGLQWGPAMIGCAAAWDPVSGWQGSSNTKIAILDTGVKYTHEDLTKTVLGYDFVNADADPMDDHGHGTHCAGIAAADTNNSLGVAGVGFNCVPLAIKVLNASGSGTMDNVAAGVDYAVSHGARVISMSLAGTADASTLHTAIDNAWAAGVVVCAAAGNNGNTTKMYPAADENCIAVGATTDTDARASYSNYDPSWVDIGAPGDLIYSTYLTGYQYMSGTSMATPCVAGAAGLLYDKLTLERNLTSAQIVRNAIEQHAHAILLDSFKYGRLDLAASMAAINTLKKAGVTGTRWTSPLDYDGDSYKRQATLKWTVTVTVGVGNLSVYEKLYWRVHGSTAWNYLTTTSTRNVYGAAPVEVGTTIAGRDHNLYDFRIVVFSGDRTTPDALDDAGSDATLSSYAMELVSQDASLHATVANTAWASEVDLDGDGYKRSAYLTWNSNVADGSGSILVLEKIYWRVHGTTTWTYYTSTSPHTIVGTATDDTQTIPAPTLSHGTYDFRIAIFRNGETTPDYLRDGSNDASLNAYKLETPAQDVRAVIADAWISNVVDLDGDGYARSAKLSWDPNVSGSDAAQTVYEKVYWRVHGTTAWTFLTALAPHSITGTGWGDIQSVDISGRAHNLYDYRVVIFRVGQSDPDDIRDSSNDADLNSVKMELPSQDQPTATIGDVSWSNAVDNDSDGYVRSARLTWDPNVVGSGSLSVFEKVYWRLHGTTAWTFLAATSPHSITGTATDDTAYLDIGGRDHNLYDFRIVIFRQGQTTPDFIKDSSNSTPLSGYQMETPNQD